MAIAWAGDIETGKSVDEVISIPMVDAFRAPIIAVIPLQLLAYYASWRVGMTLITRVIRRSRLLLSKKRFWK